MSYAQPQHGGAADSYYQLDGQQQDIGMQNRGNGQPQYQQQYQQGPPPQQYQQGPPQQYQQNGQQYQQQPPQFSQAPPQYGKQPNYGGGDKQDFHQTFKVDKPKFNDIWAALLFLACFAGFTAVSGLSIYGYSATKGQQGGGIYGATTLELNTNTIVLLYFSTQDI
jgi:hypothetical protein